MKKGLIKEAFRLQQIAGIAPVNEIFDTDNDQYMGKYADAYSRISVSNDGEYSANDPSDEEAVKLAGALTALYDEHGENGVDAWQSGAIDIEDYMNESASGLQNEGERGYVEVMGPDFDQAMDLLNKAWTDWKNGPETVDADLRPAKENILFHIEQLLSFM